MSVNWEEFDKDVDIENLKMIQRKQLQKNLMEQMCRLESMK